MPSQAVIDWYRQQGVGPRVADALVATAAQMLAEAAARSKRSDAELAAVATYGPTPRTGLARDYDVAHAAGTLLKVRQGVDVPAPDAERAATFLAGLEA